MPLGHAGLIVSLLGLVILRLGFCMSFYIFRFCLFNRVGNRLMVALCADWYGGVFLEMCSCRRFMMCSEILVFRGILSYPL